MAENLSPDLFIENQRIALAMFCDENGLTLDQADVILRGQTVVVRR